MDHQAPHRVPLGIVYALLAILFVWATAYRISVTADMLRLEFHPDRVPAPIFVVGWPDGKVQLVSFDFAERSNPPFKRGDRLLAIEGSPYRTPAQVEKAMQAAGPQGTLHALIARADEHGNETTFESTVAMRSIAEGKKEVPSRLLVAVLGLFMPWVGLLVGFWVAAVRPRDPMAWLVLTMLLAFSQIGALQGFTYHEWPTWIRLLGETYEGFFSVSWPIWFPLFGVHFAGRLEWERRWRWITPLALAPYTAFAAVVLVQLVAAVVDARAIAPLFRSVDRVKGLALPAAMVSISYFFVVMGWKQGHAAAADARRRLRILMWGATVALTPILCVVLVAKSRDSQIGELPVWLFVPSLLLLVIFPLTLAYVIVVDRAMDVRVAVRQGLRYAATRGAIRFVVFCAMAAAIWNVWRLVDDPERNRPQKLRGIALGMMAAVVVPRAARGAFRWTDRRFFREAYDAEHVLTGLADEVRMIGETGPLLDTVLDTIGSTLHVDKLAVFLLDGDRFVPSRSRGFDPPPTVVFPATSDALRRLRESGRPARIRHDATDGPLHRETISEYNRALLATLDAELLLPLRGRRELLGVVTLGPKKSEEPYSPSDAKLLGLVANQTGLALENSRLTETIATEIAKRERMHREIEIARDVQQKLFPQRIPEVTGVDSAGFCRPAQGVGGDYYDFLALSGGRLGLALGDVSGKGIPAALLMAGLQASLRGQRLSGSDDLARLVTNLNHLLYEASPDNRYATFFYAELDAATLRLDYVNAGHNAPMLFRGGAGTIERLAATGPVVGLLEGGRYEQRSVILAPGDLLLVFSDGVSEAMNVAEEEWGEGRLQAAVRSAGRCRARELIERLLADADAFAGGATQHDDMTLVVLRVNP